MSASAVSLSSTGYPDEAEPSLLSSILRKRKRVVVVITAVAVFAAVVLTMRQTPIYETTSAVVVETPPSQSAAGGPNMATEAQVARSLAVARIVRRDLHLHVSPSTLANTLSVRVPVDSDVVQFTYSSPQPEVAQKRAQSFADAYLALRRDQLKTQLAASAASIDGRIRFLTNRSSALGRQISRATREQAAILRAQRNALTTQIGTLQQKIADLNSVSTSASPGAVVTSAPLPLSPSHPRIGVNAALAVFIGLLLGVAVAAAQEYGDDRLRGGSDLKARFGAPVLGSIPAGGPEQNGDGPLTPITLRAPGSDDAEAFRRLRTNFLAAASDVGATSVLVTSAEPSAQKTSVAANLAVALAAAGKRVVLISADERPPTLEEQFGVPEGVGFFQCLRDSMNIARDSGVENLWLCGSGLSEVGTEGFNGNSRASVDVTRTPAAELAASDRAGRAIEAFAEDFEFVIVDAPPLLAVADAAALAVACHAVLVVATLGTARRTDVVQAREQLERVRVTSLGAVLVDREHRGEAHTPLRADVGMAATVEQLTAAAEHQPSGRHQYAEGDDREVWRDARELY
jgi:polysaccharide biosynthesis transport protein